MSKKIIALVLASVAAVLFLSSCQAPEEKVYPYPFDTAKITYSISGQSTGERVMFIKGNNLFIETHVTRTNNGVEERLDMITISSGEYLYQIDLNTKTGTTTKNAIYEELNNTPAAERAAFLTKVAIGVAESDTQQLQPKEQKDIAGQKCDLYLLPNVGEACLWNTLSLYSKMEVPQAGISDTMTATKVETGLEVSDQKFEIRRNANFPPN